MNYHQSIRAGADYRSFNDGWTGLAAMILTQAAVDVSLLDGKPYKQTHEWNLSRWELLYFFQSEWAADLARALKLDRRQLLQFAEARL